ncbi:MAG TPA: hypothetical protein VGO47_10285 [Chlamydiales bacterium]|nr:hypothetical protein [Chlamydiales bacterium]
MTSTTIYAAKEEGSGKTFLFRIHISATAGQKPEFIITEERFYSEALDMMD